jgi:hypothetical protein
LIFHTISIAVDAVELVMGSICLTYGVLIMVDETLLTEVDDLLLAVVTEVLLTVLDETLLIGVIMRWWEQLHRGRGLDNLSRALSIGRLGRWHRH